MEHSPLHLQRQQQRRSTLALAMAVTVLPVYLISTSWTCLFTHGHRPSTNKSKNRCHHRYKSPSHKRMMRMGESLVWDSFPGRCRLRFLLSPLFRLLLLLPVEVDVMMMMMQWCIRSSNHSRLSLSMAIQRPSTTASQSRQRAARRRRIHHPRQQQQQQQQHRSDRHPLPFLLNCPLTHQADNNHTPPTEPTWGSEQTTNQRPRPRTYIHQDNRGHHQRERPQRYQQ